MSVKVMKTALEALEHCEPCCVENPKGFKLWAKVMPLLREELISHNLSKEKKDCIKPNQQNISNKIHEIMTIRDYFAAKAMQAFISAYPCQAIDGEDGGIPTDAESISGDAYEMADAMLKAREK